MNVFDAARDHENLSISPADILLTDQIAVVTGGGGGIGQGIAIGLARFGATVGVLDIDAARAARTAEVIAASGGRSVAIAVDVMDADALRAAVATIGDRYGRLDILVNNAGGVRSAPFMEQNERSWRRHIDINMVSLLTATSAAVPLMIDGGRGGSIVNVSSIEGSRAAPTYAVYSACKAGMNNFTQTMALELSEHAIRVNAIAPDHTITPGNRGNRNGPVDPSTWIVNSPERQSALDDIIPIGREGLVEECASVVVFLCSKMAAYVTGAILPVDGGTAASSGWLRNPTGGWTQTR